MTTITGTSEDDFIHKAGDGHSGNGNQIPTATDAADTINGLGGNDTIYPGFGNDIISGGSGNDTIYANDSDTASGGFGNDVLTTIWTTGHTGTATLNGDAGHDTFIITFVGPLSQTVSASGGTGFDTFNVDGHGTATLDGGDGDDIFVLTDVTTVTLTLGAGVDWVTLGLQDALPVVTINDFQAGEGGDVLHLDPYLDSVLAGWDHKTNPFGIDLLRLTTAASDTILQVKISGVWHDLIVLKDIAADDLVAANLSGFPPDGSPPSVTTTYGETKESSQLNYPDDHHFTITGLGGPDIIYGGTFNETIHGGAGDDQLYGRPYAWPANYGIVLDGGSGDDLLAYASAMTGGQGSDTFVFHRGDPGIFITDFTPGVDQLVLDGYAEVLEIEAGANGTTIYLNGGTFILDDVDAASLTPDDIVFVPGPLLPPPPAIPTPTGSPITTPLETPTYTLDTGENVWFDGNGYVLFVEPPSQVVDGVATIAGTITKTLSNADVSSVFASYGGMDVTVTPTGVVYFDDTRDGPSYDYAFFMFANDCHLDNQGAITLISDNTNVTGVRNGDGTVVNSGTIYIWAGQKAIGVDSSNGGNVDNQAGGVIDVAGQNGAIGVALSSVGAGHGDFNNAGTISATGGSAVNASMAVYLGARPYTFVNSGILEGDYSLYLADNSSIYLYPGEVIGPYVNSGQMYGVVRLSYTDDTLQNSGLIDGAVYLGLGNDIYEGTSGTQDGGVYGGDGHDQLTGGAGAEYLFGGEGDDSIHGGGGDDFIDGGRGNNVLDGGDGNDTLSFASLNAGVNVNLLTNIFSAPGIAGTIWDFENVSGTIFDDVLTGTGAANTVTGGKGDDALIGGAGDDTFRFVIGDGGDVVTDFVAGGAQDSLRIYGYSGYQSLIQEGANTRVVLSATDSILLANVLVGSLLVQDFNFSVALPSATPASPLIAGSDTITLTANYTVAAGEVMTFNGRDRAFHLEHTQQAFYLANDGDVSITAYGNVAGVEGRQNISMPFTNASGASFEVVNLAPFGTAYGIYLTDLYGMHLVNWGEFAVRSNADAYGIKAPYSGQSITNLGEFTVQAEGAAFGAVFSNGGLVSNSGNFEVHGGTAATGVQINNFSGSGFYNTGTFTVIVDDPDVASVAARLFFEPNNESISNSGTITADKAFVIETYSVQSTDTLTIANSGVINGDIEVAGVSTSILNPNTINGDVILSARNDSFYGDTGTLNGSIDGGSGNELIYAGIGHATLRGGAGNDNLNGGPGFDTAVFSGNKSSYSIIQNGAQITVSGPDGTDILTGIERLVFDNTTVEYTPARTANDSNGDRSSDLLWQNDDGRAAVWLLNGSTPIGSGFVGNDPGPGWHIVGAADFNNDSKADILWENDHSRAAVWLLNGTNILFADFIGNDPGEGWHIKGSGDFNGDGKADVLWQNNYGRAAVWLLNGTSFVTTSFVGGDPGPSWHIKGAGDFNGDGKSDILWQHNDGRAMVWLLNGTSVIGSGVVGNPGADWRVAGSGDFNGDGKSDILWQNGDDLAALWLMNGVNRLDSNAPAFGDDEAGWFVKGAGDFNNDGSPDILRQNVTGQAEILFMKGTMWTGTGTLSNPGSAWTIANYGVGSLAQQRSDFNGDGRSDILWQNDDGNLAAWLLKGSAIIDEGSVGTNDDPVWQVKATGDFNGDGKWDVLWQHDDGTARIWFLDGLTHSSGGTVGNPGADWHIKATGDFNADGKSDILWQNTDGRAAVWLMNNLTVLNGNLVGSDPGAGWIIKGSGDFNSDGKSDILWENADDGRAAVWLVDGWTVLDARAVGGVPGAGWHVRGSGDFDGDGNSDVLWQNDDGRAAVWLLDGVELIGADVVGDNADTSQQVKGAADYNGDAKSDILWLNDDGQAEICFMDGLTVADMDILGTAQGSEWHFDWA